jgi:hypothetical protein
VLKKSRGRRKKTPRLRLFNSTSRKKTEATCLRQPEKKEAVNYVFISSNVDKAAEVSQVIDERIPREVL